MVLNCTVPQSSVLDSLDLVCLAKGLPLYSVQCSLLVLCTLIKYIWLLFSFGSSISNLALQFVATVFVDAQFWMAKYNKLLLNPSTTGFLFQSSSDLIGLDLFSWVTCLITVLNAPQFWRGVWVYTMSFSTHVWVLCRSVQFHIRCFSKNQIPITRNCRDNQCLI